MKNQSPSPSQVLGSLPEIVSEIICALKRDSNSIATCLRVNSLWFKEAARVLWKKCGFDSGFTEIPEIACLASLANNPRRLQIYAYYIQHLWFEWHDARYQCQFATTSFPRLKSVTFWNSPGFNQPSLLLPYLQPALEEFAIWRGSMTTECLGQINVSRVGLGALTLNDQLTK